MNTAEFHQLPAGVILKDRYQIREVLGQGGFGITYKGYDRTLDTMVAIKEYFPFGIAYRIRKIRTPTTNFAIFLD